MKNELYRNHPDPGLPRLLSIIDSLQGVSDDELLFVLREVFEKRRELSSSDLSFEESTYYLGLATRTGEGGYSTDWEFAAVAYADPIKEGGGAPDIGLGPAIFCQNGTCRGCGMIQFSHRKRGICAICGHKVYLT